MVDGAVTIRLELRYEARTRYWIRCCIMMATTKGQEKTAGSQDIIMRAARSRDCLVSSPRYYFHVSISM